MKATSDAGFTLTELLMGVVFFCGPLSAIETAKKAGGGVGGYLVALAVGLTIGIALTWVMWKGFAAVARRLSDAPHRWALPAVLLWTILCAWAATGLSISMTGALLRVVGR